MSSRMLRLSLCVSLVLPFLVFGPGIAALSAEEPESVDDGGQAPEDQPLLVAYLEEVSSATEVLGMRITFEANVANFVSEVLPWTIFVGTVDEDGHPEVMNAEVTGSVTVKLEDLIAPDAVWVGMPDSYEAWLEVELSESLDVGQGAYMIAVETTANRLLGENRLGYDELGSDPIEHDSYVSQDGGVSWVSLSMDELESIAGIPGIPGIDNSNYLELQNRGNP